MGELHLIGIGIGPRGWTVDAIEAARSCDRLFAEFYTAAPVDVAREDIERAVGRSVAELDRADVEAGEKVLGPALEHRVGLLVVGDPLASTTHVDLRLRAIERGIRTRVHHGVSIFTIVPGLLGLQQVKFGRTASIPRRRTGFDPESPYEAVVANRQAGLHTLVLLDTGSPEGKALTASDGIARLLEIDSRRKLGVITPDTLVAAVARVGAEVPAVHAGRAREVPSWTLGPPPHTLVVPGQLHFQEADALAVLAGADRKLLESSVR